MQGHLSLKGKQWLNTPQECTLDYGPQSPVLFLKPQRCKQRASQAL